MSVFFAKTRLMKCYEFKKIFRIVLAFCLIGLLLSAIFFASQLSNTNKSPINAAAKRAEIDTVIEDVCDGGIYMGRRFNEKYDYMLDNIGVEAKTRLTGESFYDGDGAEITMGGYMSLSAKGDLKKKYRYLVITINGIINPDGVFVTLCDAKNNHLGTKSLSQLKGPDEKPIPYSILEPTGFVIDPVKSGFNTDEANFSSVVIDAIEGASIILKEIFLTDMEGDYSIRDEKILDPQSVIVEDGELFDLKCRDKKVAVFRMRGASAELSKDDVMLENDIAYKIFTKERASYAAAYYNKNRENILTVFYCDYIDNSLIKPDYNKEYFLKGERNDENSSIKFNLETNASDTENGWEEENKFNYRYLKIKTTKNISDIKISFYISDELMEIESDDYQISNTSYGYKTLKNISQTKDYLLIDLLKCNVSPFTAIMIKGEKPSSVSLIAPNYTQKNSVQEIENNFCQTPQLEETLIKS